MKILIKGKRSSYIALREYVEKRIGKITRYFEGELKDATVTLVVERICKESK